MRDWELATVVIVSPASAPASVNVQQRSPDLNESGGRMNLLLDVRNEMSGSFPSRWDGHATSQSARRNAWDWLTFFARSRLRCGSQLKIGANAAHDAEVVGEIVN